MSTLRIRWRLQMPHRGARPSRPPCGTRPARALLQSCSLALCLVFWPAPAASVSEPLAELGAASLRLSLPTGSQRTPTVMLQWLGHPLSWQPFTVPLPIDEAAQALLRQFPASLRPVLQVEPGMAMLTWFDTGTHWLLRLTGARLDRGGWQTTGNLSGWRVSAQTGAAACVESPGPAPLVVPTSMSAELRCLFGYDMPRTGIRASIRVYAGPAARAQRLLALMADAGWLPCSAALDVAWRCRGRARARIDCATDASRQACVVTTEEPA